MLIVVLVPATYYMLLQPIIYGEISINFRIKNCKCFECNERMKKRSAIYRFSWFNKLFLAKLLFVAYLWFLCY